MHRRFTAMTSVATVAVAVAGLGLTSCSSGSGSSSDGISYMTWESTTTNDAFDATMAKFEKSSGLTVDRVEAPNENYPQKLASLILAKKAPDFFWCTTAQAQNLAAEGLVHDWSKELEAGDGLKADGFAPGALDMWKTADGKVAGIPTLANTYGFYYNADALTAAGVPIPAAGWTWDDLFSDIATLKTTDPASTPLAVQWPLLYSPQGVSAYSVANGGKPFLDDFAHASSVETDATFTEGFQRMADAIAAGQMTNPDFDTANSNNEIATFSNGGYPLMFGGQWLQNFIEPNKPTFAWGFAPWPKGTSGDVQPIEANGVCSPATIKDPASVWKAISYLDTTGFNEAMKAQPVAPIAYTEGSQGYYDSLGAKGDDASKSIEATAKYELAAQDKFITQFLDPWSTKAADIVTTSWNPALQGKASAEDGIAATASGVQGLIGK